MSRPVGSKNRPKAVPNGRNVFTMNFEKQVEGAAVTKDSGMGWIKNGAKNNYPQLLLDLYQNSPTHRAAINFEVQCVVGEGLDYEAMGLDETQTFPNYWYSWDTLLRNITLDYMLYGSYGIQIIKNKDNQTYSFYHIPYEKLRCSPYDDDGVITSWWVSNDWTQIGLNPPIEIKAIDMRDDDEIKQGRPYIYVFRNYDPTQVYYQSPSYAAGIKSIQSEIEYCTYDLKNITNSFTPAGVLSLPEVETEEEKQAIIDNVTRMFVGSENANSLLINFRNNIEGNNVEYVPFSKNQGSFNFYEDANQRTINRILCCHNIPSASLVGMPDVSNSGFASDSKKLEAAYQLYQKLTGNYNRQVIVKTLNDMFKLNKINVEVVLKPIHFYNEEDAETSDTTSEDTNQDVSTDNIEEQVS